MKVITNTWRWLQVKKLLPNGAFRASHLLWTCQLSALYGKDDLLCTTDRHGRTGIDTLRNQALINAPFSPFSFISAFCFQHKGAWSPESLLHASTCVFVYNWCAHACLPAFVLHPTFTATSKADTVWFSRPTGSGSVISVSPHVLVKTTQHLVEKWLFLEVILLTVIVAAVLLKRLYAT